MPKPLRADVPPHHPLGVRVEVAAGGDHPGSDDVAPIGPVGTHRHHGGRPVAEQPAGHQVGHRRVVALHRQGAQFHRQQDADVVRPAAEVVVQPGDPGRAGDAAEPEQRHPFDVFAEPDLGVDPGLQRRNRQAGDGGGEDHVDLICGQPGGLQRAVHRRDAQIDRDFQIGVVGLGEVRQLPVAIKRQRQVPAAHPGVGVHPSQHLVASAIAQHVLGECLGDLVLRVPVWRQNRMHGSKAGHAGHSTVTIGACRVRRFGLRMEHRPG